jgi:hypothetical protein
VIAGSTVGRAFVDGVLLAHLSHGSGYLFVSLSPTLSLILSRASTVRTDRTALSFPTLLGTKRRVK